MRDPKYDAPDMPGTFTCHGCGRELASTDDITCPVDWLCTDCTPAAGNCLDCADARREIEADRLLRLSKEARDW